MNRLSRTLAAGAVALGAVLVTASCSASPQAASVNGQGFSSQAVNSELRSLSANSAYIRAVDQASLQSGQRVEGPSPGTYNSAWTAHVLTGMIDAAAVAQELSSRGRIPSRYQVMVARTVDSADFGPYWDRFPAPYRLTLAERTAELAMIGVPPVPVAQLRTAYQRFANYFFSSVCVREVVFGSKAAALAHTAHLRGGAALAGGTVTCYTPAQLENQPNTFVGAVLALPVGKVSAPTPVPSGYAVEAVTKRVAIPLGPAMRGTLAVVIGASSDTALQALLARDHITVDPMYGTWRGSRQTGFAVAPPTVRSGA